MKLKQLSRLGAGVVLSLSSLLTIAMPTVHAAGPYTCTWTGAGTDMNFSTPGNWSGCNNTAPVAGDNDNLVFPVVTNMGPVNDLTNAVFTSITFSGAANNAHLSGTAFSLSGGINLSATGSSYASINNDITFTGSQALAIADADAVLLLNGNVTSSAALSKSGAGSLSLSGDNTNLTGAITASAGSVILQSANAAGPAGGAGLTVNDGSEVYLGGCGDTTFVSNLTLNGNSVTPSGDAETAKLTTMVAGCRGGGGGLSLTIDTSYGTGSYGNVVATLTGTLTLGSDVTFAAVNEASTISGPIVGAHKISLVPGSIGTLTLNGNPNGSQTANGSYKPATFEKTLSDDQSTVGIEIGDNNIISVDGKRGDVLVDAGGTLKGTGSVAQLEVAGIVAPGHSPGCLTTGNFMLDNSGTYQAEIGGTDACTGYDQLKVTGTVSLNGNLKASLYNGFVPAVGQSYTIIDNDASDAVTGTFAGIAEGAEYTNDGVTYTVTYKGGDGNDVVLTVKSIDASKLPAKPNTGIKLVAAHPLVSLLITVAAAAGLLVASRKLSPAKR